jgi:hypothetical protein
VRFFDDELPAPPAPSPLPPPEQPWLGPPEGWIGGFVPLRLVLARTPQHLVTIGSVEALPHGVLLHLRILSRISEVDGVPGGDDSYRFGVGFADGRKWQTGMADPRIYDPGPDDVVVVARGGGGSSNHLRAELWLWPLPPPGPLTFAFEWERAGIGESLVTIDGGALHAAAAEAEQLWDPLHPIEQAELHARRHQVAGAPFPAVRRRPTEN